MNKVMQYCFSLVLISVTAGVVMMLAPRGKRLSRYLSWIIALCVTAALIAPIGSIRSVIADYEGKYTAGGGGEYDAKSSERMMIEALRAEIADKVAAAIRQKFSQDCAEITVALDESDPGNLILESIDIVLESRSGFLAADTQKYISGMFGCEVSAVGGEDNDR